MKKTFLLLCTFGLLLSANYTQACSAPVGQKATSVDDLLSRDDTALYLLRPLKSGSIVKAEVIVGNKNAELKAILQRSKDSCTTRTKDFSPGEYIVVISEPGTNIIQHDSFDKQFSFPFKTKDQAFFKYNQLRKKWETGHTMDTSTGKMISLYTPALYSLKPGMENDDVLALQKALKEVLGLGDDFKLDGKYGPGTLKMVKKFQESASLTADGLAGNKTQKALFEKIQKKISPKISNISTDKPKNSISLPGYTLKPGMENDDVLALQKALKEVLGLGDDFKLDGKYGPGTLKMVKKFQESASLTADGLAGNKTQKALFGKLTMEKLPEKQGPKIEKGKKEEKKPEESKATTDVVENFDVINGQIKKVLQRAKADINNYSTGIRNYTDAHSVVVKYNNEILTLYQKSDPLYKSSNGGRQFIYFAKLANGMYACVDNDNGKDIVESKKKPGISQQEVSC